MKEVEEYLKQRLLVNNNGDVFTKFDELVSVVSSLAMNQYNRGYCNSDFDTMKLKELDEQTTS